MDYSSVTVLGFQFESERDFLPELFFSKDIENETEQERSSNRISQALKEWWKCGK